MTEDPYISPPGPDDRYFQTDRERLASKLIWARRQVERIERKKAATG